MVFIAFHIFRTGMHIFMRAPEIFMKYVRRDNPKSKFTVFTQKC